MVDSIPPGGELLHLLLRRELPRANIPLVLVVTEGILGMRECVEVVVLKGDVMGAILLSVTLILEPPLPSNGSQLVILVFKLKLRPF